MSRKTEHTSFEAYASDLSSEFRGWAKQEMGGLEGLVQGNGYTWMHEYLEGILENQASGSRLPVTELMKTPSRTHTTKKTRTITTAVKDRTAKVTLANAKLLGSPMQKSNSARAPLSPLGGRTLNTTPGRLFQASPAKSPINKANSPIPVKADKAKAKPAAKKARTKKNPDEENAVPDAETSTSSRSAISTSASSRGDGMLGSKPASSRPAALTPPRPPRSPERSAPPAPSPKPAEVAVIKEALNVGVEDQSQPMPEEGGAGEGEHETHGAIEEEAMEGIEEEAEEEILAPPPKATPTSLSGPSRPRTVDLSVIAEAEENRTSITIPTSELPSAPSRPIPQSRPEPAVPASLPPAVATSASVIPAPTEPAAEPVLTTIPEPVLTTIPLETPSLPVESTEPAPSTTAAPVSSKQVRSSWLSKALGAATPHPAPQQRTSDGTNRTSVAPAGMQRLSTADYPTMRKSLAQPGVLAKRKSGEGVTEGEGAEDEEKRPEKMARVEAVPPVAASAPVVAVVKAVPPPALAAPVVPISKPSFDRQYSQESFIRPAQPTVLAPSIATASAEKPASGMDRVTKALDDMRERQQAKDAAKQKAALSVSIATPVSAPVRTAGTGAGFLRGLGNSLGRSLGLGMVGYKDAEEMKTQQEKEEEEEARRKAQADLSEIMKKMEAEEGSEGEEDMDMEMDEEEAHLQPAGEMETDEEEVNESIEIDEEEEEDLGSPEKPVPAAPANTQTSAPTSQKSSTPSRVPRHLQSTTPQGTPPRSQPVAALAGDSQRQLRSSPKQQITRPARGLDGSIMEPTGQTIHDRIKLFNGSSLASTSHAHPAQSTRGPLVFSPGRTGNKASDAIEIDDDDASVPKKGSRVLSSDPEEEEEPVEYPASSRAASPRTISRATSSASLATSLFGQASTMANKALGVKPTVGQVKSTQLAASAYKKDLAASERRAQTKEQRIKSIADRKAEEERKVKEREAEEKRMKALEMEKRRREGEERKVQIAKAKAEKAERERKEREAAERAEMEAEAIRKQKLASSQSKAPMQPAKRVISASSSTTNLLNGSTKMKEPVKLTKPSGPLPSAHGSSKLVPSTFRTAPVPPETPANQMSHACSIRLVGQPQPQPQPSQQAQADRKPLGPPTRPSAIRASHQAQAIRQSAAVASQHQHQAGSSSTASVLTQSRLALQNQLEAEAAELASEEIVLPDIASEYSDSGDETDDSPAFKRPQWAESPELRAALAAQASKNPDELFGPIRPLSMEELFKAQKGKFRSRTSSGNWQRDGLKKEEEEEYARRMGFTTGTGKW